MEVSFSMPAPLPNRVQLTEHVLKVAEAIARDVGIDIEMQIIRARSISDAILDLVHRGDYDLDCQERCTKSTEKNRRD